MLDISKHGFAIVDVESKYDLNSTIIYKEKVNTTGYEVYWRLNNFSNYLQPGQNASAFSYQEDYRIFSCPTRNCTNITELIEIEKPFETLNPQQRVV